MKQKIITSLALGWLASATLAAENGEADLAALKRQLSELDQKVRILERKGELAEEAVAEKAKALPVLALGANGFSFSSADSNFVAQIHGVIQFDSRTFFQDGGLQNNDSFLLRRARPILSGTVFRDFDYLFVPDFGGSTVQIFDASLTYRYRPELQLQAGKFKSPVGLEHLQADVNTAFNERSLATDLVPNRDVGAQVKGDLGGGVLSYAAGIFNGAPDYNGTTANSESANDIKEFAGRVFAAPFKNSQAAAVRGLGFGVGGSYGTERGAADLTPGYKTDGQQTFFTYANGVANGTHWRVSPQASYYYGPFSLLGEYVISDQRVATTNFSHAADLQNTAWEVTAGWVLTGEAAAYTGVAPRHPFDPATGQWGAFQLVGRYAALDVDDAAFPYFANPAASASGARSWAVGLNWYLNRDLRVNASFSHTTFSAAAGKTGAVIRQPEAALFTRIQLAF